MLCEEVRRSFKLVVLTTFAEKWFFKLIIRKIRLNSLSNVFVLLHPLCLILLFYLKLLQHHISKMSIVITVSWESLGSEKLIMKKLRCVVCIPKTCTCTKLETTNIHQSWHLTNYPEVSLFLFLAPTSLSLSAVWHQSPQRKGACNRSFLSPSCFSLLFISPFNRLPLFYYTTNLSNPDLFLSSSLNVAVKYWVGSRWQRKRRTEVL